MCGIAKCVFCKFLGPTTTIAHTHTHTFMQFSVRAGKPRLDRRWLRVACGGLLAKVGQRRCLGCRPVRTRGACLVSVGVGACVLSWAEPSGSDPLDPGQKAGAIGPSQMDWAHRVPLMGHAHWTSAVDDCRSLKDDIVPEIRLLNAQVARQAPPERACASHECGRGCLTSGCLAGVSWRGYLAMRCQYPSRNRPYSKTSNR